VIHPNGGWWQSTQWRILAADGVGHTYGTLTDVSNRLSREFPDEVNVGLYARYFVSIIFDRKVS
jgi:hypothetical protein